jgi:hypothetical protein
VGVESPRLDLRVRFCGFGVPPLTHEDLDRSADRARVYRARQQGRRWYLLWLLVGVLTAQPINLS